MRDWLRAPLLPNWEAWRSKWDAWMIELVALLRSFINDNTYTPVLTQLGAVGVTVQSGRYHKVGRRVTGTVYVTATGAGTAANVVTLTIPLDTEVSNAVAIGAGYFLDANTGAVYPVIAYRSGAGVASFMISAATGVNPYLGTSAVWNLAIAAGDVLTLQLNYSSNTP